MGIRTRWAALVAVVAFAVACNGGGAPGDGGDRVAPDDWLATVCGATTAWVDEITVMNEDLQSSLDPGDVVALKDTMVGYFDDLLAATDDMIGEVEAAGVPDVDEGREASEAISSGLGDARAVLQLARDAAADLPTNDQRAFGEELQAIAQEVQTSLGEVGDAMAGFESPALDRAAEDVPECRELNEL